MQATAPGATLKGIQLTNDLNRSVAASRKAMSKGHICWEKPSLNGIPHKIETEAFF